ncbi:MAG: tagaturonate reductase [Adhaeribacter sp.]
MMTLNWRNLTEIKPRPDLVIPDVSLFDLPEKVLQFGTGVLLRGLPDFFIDKANRQGFFKGRVVVVKSTSGASPGDFASQDNLYTLCSRGIDQGQPVGENIICSAISRVLAADSDWEQVLQVAASTQLEVIVSNTTEAGIALVDDDIHATPPQSFPGKLLAVLLTRYQRFSGDSSKGLVVVPTELVPGNGDKLRDIVLKQARRHQLDEGFFIWLQASVVFCNSLVDRIVPGKPGPEALAELEQELGYHDALLTMTEPYRLWAIEGDEKVAQVLSFAQADAGVVIAPNIDQYRELKLRLLNGTHTLSCGLALLAGVETVQQAMDDPELSAFIAGLMQQEIAPAIPYPVEADDAAAFAAQVLDRFRNPHIRHPWISITLGYSAKLKLRVIPVLFRYYERFGQAPGRIALGFAAYLRFMSSLQEQQGRYLATIQGQTYPVQDEQAAYFQGLASLSPEQLADAVLQNQQLWGQDLSALPGFAGEVKNMLNTIDRLGARQALREVAESQASADR